MLYTDFKAGNKEYKLRLNTRNVVALEKQIGCNPLGIFGGGDTIPKVDTMVAILHASMQQYEHGISLNDTYDIFDAFLDDGNSIADFVSVIIDIYKVSGILPNEETVKN